MVLDEKIEFFSLLLTMKVGLLKLNYCWMGRESWHAIKKLFNLPFLNLKSGVWQETSYTPGRGKIVPRNVINELINVM